MRDRFPIRTLHLLPELKEGGLERGVVEKAVWLQDHGIGAGVVSAGGIWLERLSAEGVTHFTLPIDRKNPFSMLGCVSALRRIIRDEGIHLVCAHSRAPAWAAHFATRNGAHHDPPLIIEAQGYYETYWYSNVMRLGEKIIAVSGAIRDYMVDELGAEPDRTTVIPRGFAPSEFSRPNSETRDRLRAEWKIPHDAPLVAGVGRLTHTKGWDDLLDALTLMPEPRPYCVLAGTAHGRRRRYVGKLKRQIESGDLRTLVRFVGHREDIPNVYAAADLVVAPSRLPEPFGRVIIESLMFGCPVITTEGCGAAEYLGDEFRQFLVPPNNPQSLADRISEIMNDLTTARTAVNLMSEIIRTDLTLDRQMNATLDVYRECRPDLPWPDTQSVT